MPRPDFPRTLAQFQRRFASEEACRAYLAASRWPDGYRCPKCRHREARDLRARLLWRCLACGHDTSVTAGTVLHRTRTSLTQWFWAADLVTSHTPGLSALPLQRQLGIARYETAWVMLHKLRRAMVGPDRAPLHTEVEVDEAYLGGPEAGLRGGRVLEDQALVVAAVEVRGRGSGRIRLQVVPDASARSLSGFVRANVEPGETILAGRPNCGRGSIECSATSRPGCAGPITGSATSICRSTSTSSPSGSTVAVRRRQPSKHSSASALSGDRRPTSSCMRWSKPDKH